MSARTGSSPSTAASARSSTTKARRKSPGMGATCSTTPRTSLRGSARSSTVTTVHDGEVRRILGEAMRKLGIAQDSESVSRVLSRLMGVSGRLALRLLRDTTLAVEAVSLAAVMAHLERRDQFDGRIVVPVDAHPEIFGVRAGDEMAGQAVRPPACQGHPALTAHRVRRGEGTAGRAVADRARRQHRRAA